MAIHIESEGPSRELRRGGPEFHPCAPPPLRRRHCRRGAPSPLLGWGGHQQGRDQQL